VRCADPGYDLRVFPPACGEPPYTIGMTSTAAFIPLRICVLTVSDSRTLAEDGSGDYLAVALAEAGHVLHERALLPDDRYRLRALVSQWIADASVDGVLVTGGTGFTGRDSTPEALLPLLDKTMPGFGEIFRAISFEEIATSSLQSRAFAGLANGTFVFALPGSTSACRTAWERILRAQLDARTRPCNLATLRPRLGE
jgi:molybdenum cofactor biosynthesis protein B